jgi:hypothetical protein
MAIPFTVLLQTMGVALFEFEFFWLRAQGFLRGWRRFRRRAVVNTKK